MSINEFGLLEEVTDKNLMKMIQLFEKYQKHSTHVGRNVCLRILNSDLADNFNLSKDKCILGFGMVDHFELLDNKKDILACIQYRDNAYQQISEEELSHLTTMYT